MFRLLPDWQSVFYGKEDYTPFHLRTGKSQEVPSQLGHDEIHLADNPVQHILAVPQNLNLSKHLRFYGTFQKNPLQSYAAGH